MAGHLGEIAAIAALIVLQAFFVAAEIALVSARRSALTAAADSGSRAARRALHLLEDPSRLLSTISAAITLVGFTASAIAAVTFEGPMTAWLRSLGLTWLDRISGGLSVFLVTLAVTYVTLVFGELTPKRLGLQRAENVAGAVAGPVEWIAIGMAPVVWILSRSTDLVAGLIGVGRGEKPGVSEEEIKLLVTEQGTLLEEEKRMIHEVLELGDTVAREVMVPRVDTHMLEDSASVEQALGAFQQTGFSRMPVYHDDPDSIVGLVLLKDLVAPVSEGDAEANVSRCMRSTLFVPETKPILDLLSEMRASRTHLAVVVDEHGGTAGIVTIEDIVEEIVGEISDESDPDWRLITPAGEGRWIVDGRLPTDDARERLGLPVPESEEYETLAGWVLAELGHVPVAGESVAIGAADVRVIAVRRRRISRLLVTLSQKTSERGDERG